MNTNFPRSTTIMPNVPSYHQAAPMSIQDVSHASRNQPYPQRQPSHPFPGPGPAPGPGGRRDADATLTQGFARMSLSTQIHANPPINVVLFGEPGVGKSAVVNLIARQNVARVPSSGSAATLLQSVRYDVSLDDINVCVFETMGFGEPEIRADGYLSALERAHEFVNQLSAVGGVHLVLFCVRANKLTSTTQSNYRLLSEVVFQAKMPITVVVTGLEGESTMEGWWTRNKTTIERYGLKSDSHACITAVTDRFPRQDYNHAESQKRIHELLKSYSLKTPASLPQPNDWFLRIGIGMRQYVDKHQKPTREDIRNMLERLRLDPKTVQGFLDMMEWNVQPNSRGGAGRPIGGHWKSEGEVDTRTPKPSMPSGFQDREARQRSDWPPDPGMVEIVRGGGYYAAERGRWENEPPRRATVEAADMHQSQHRYQNAAEEEDKRRWWDNGTGGGETSAGKVAPEPRKANKPYVKGDMDVSMEDIRSNFPHDLTGHVTKSSKHPLAQGSYGDIYKGRFSMNGRSIDVAIKVYKVYLQRDDSFPQRMKRFHREIVVWVKLDHRNVLQLFGVIRDPNVSDVPAMVCPWVENGSLTTHLERNMGLALTARLILVDDVAHGLQYLHSQSVVHGDLSGSNVLVRADGSACIADFGLSTLLTKLGGQSFATTRQQGGTVRWMAPELLDSDGSHTSPTPRSDVYSFGSIMLQVLTGTIPYHHLSRDEQVIYAIFKGTKPDRSDPRVVTDGRWRFIEWCWFDGTRPSSDQIVEFTKRELSESIAVRF